MLHSITDLRGGNKTLFQKKESNHGKTPNQLFRITLRPLKIIILLQKTSNHKILGLNRLFDGHYAPCLDKL